MSRHLTIRRGFWLLALFASLLLCAAAQAAESKRVMVLHSFGRDFKPWNEYARTIRTELERQSPWPLDIVDHSLVTARSSDENPEGPFIDYLRALHANKPLDLIVSIGAPAAAFVQRHRATLFADTPMVFTAVDERRVQFSALTPNDAVVAVRIGYLDAIKNILQVLPDTRKITVVVGTSPVEKFWREEIAREVRPLADRVTFEWTNELSFADFLKQAATLPPNNAIFWELMIVDAAGVMHEGNAALARLHSVANAPIFSYDESFFGGEIVGGPMLSVQDGSRQTAAVAVRILGGERAGDIKIPSVTFAAPRFDWRQLQRWEISKSLLPPNSTIEFRQSTAWEQFSWQIVGAIAAVLLQALLIFWLLYEHRRRSLAEISSRNAMAELANVNRLAAAGQLSATIAHEINQPVTGMVLKASAALRWLDGAAPNLDRVRDMLNDIVGAGQRAGDIIKSVRAMFKDSTSAKVPLNLNTVINTVLELVRVDLQNAGVRMETRLDEQLPSVMGDAVQLQQVILNLVVNAAEAMRAMPPRDLTIRTTRDPSGKVQVSIEDTGTGISAADQARIFEPLFTTKGSGMGMGLSICRAIIENHGGRIWVSAAAGRGTVFHFELPAAESRSGSQDLAA